MGIIEFIPKTIQYGEIYDPPFKASSIIPDWYKHQGRYPESATKYYNEDGSAAHTVKACMPVFDALTLGYIMPSQSELNVHEDGRISWPAGLEAISGHSLAQVSEYGLNADIWWDRVYKFQHEWIIKTPEGYSCLFMHPAWRGDLPFYTLSGVVDTDTHPAAIQFPFLLRRDFVGTIELGTPIVQIIPFKRESWEAEVIMNESVMKEEILKWERATRVSGNRYKKFFRHKKEGDVE